MDENNVTQGMPEQPEAAEQVVTPEQPEAAEQVVTPEQPEAVEQAAAPEAVEQAAEPEQPEEAAGQETEPEQPEEAAGQETEPEQPEQPLQPETPIYNMYGDQVPNTPPKKKKTGLIIGIIAAAVAVIAVVLILVSVVFKKTPKEELNEALNNTFSELGESGYSVFEESLGISEIDTDDLDINAAFTLNTVSGLEGTEGATFEISGSAENKDDTIKEDISVNMQIADESLGINLYFLDGILYCSVPEIFGDAVFKINMEAVSEATDDTFSDSDRAKELYDENVGELGEQVKESVTYEKIGKTTITDHNGKDVKCTEYTVTVPAESVEEYVTAFCDYINAYADEYLTDEILSSMDMTVDEFKSLVSSIDEYYGYIFTKDFSYNAYVSNKKVIRLEADYSISLLGVKLECLVDFMGEDRVMDNVYANFSLGDAEIEYTYNQKGTSDMAETSTDIQIISSDVIMYEFVSNMEFTTETGDYSKNIEMMYKDKTFASFEIAGAITNINRGKSFDIVLDNISLIEDDTVILDISGDISYGNLDEEVKEPNLDNVYDIYSLSEDILASIFNEDNFYRIIDAWSDALDLDGFYNESEYGEFSEFIDEDDENYDEDSFSSDEYDDVVIANNSYSITINDPEGFIRAYAGDKYISIYDDIYDVSYVLYEDITDIEAVCQDLSASYSETYEVTSEELVDVDYSEGTVKAYIMTLEISSSTITEIVYYYPVQDNDYLVVTVDVWDYTGETASSSDIADMFLNTSVINISYN